MEDHCHEQTVSWNSAFSMWLLWFSGHVGHRTLGDTQDLINTPGALLFVAQTISKLPPFHYFGNEKSNFQSIMLAVPQMTHQTFMSLCFILLQCWTSCVADQQLERVEARSPCAAVRCDFTTPPQKNTKEGYDALNLEKRWIFLFPPDLF